ncbi:MAG: hypothetical protein WCP39_05945 [Chlamydiota bacterium]
MSTKSHLSRMTIDFPEADHKRLKTLASISGKSMRALIVEWVHEHLYGSHLPNDETLQAIEQAEKGENLVHCKDINDLFKKLGI